MPFASYKFKLFNFEYKIKITASSPYYLRSNDLAEKFWLVVLKSLIG